jgi:hypothetical protein
MSLATQCRTDMNWRCVELPHNGLQLGAATLQLGLNTLELQHLQLRTTVGSKVSWPNTFTSFTQTRRGATQQQSCESMLYQCVACEICSEG